MAVAATKNVTGFITNLSAEQITDAFLRFNPAPPFIAVNDTIIVGQQTPGGSVGEQVTPIAPDGAFTVPIVAIDSPTWTIAVTVDGPNIEDPKPVFNIIPPPAAGTGDVGINTVLVADPNDGPPITVISIRAATDYDNSVAPIDGQVIEWDDAIGKFHLVTASGTVTSVAGVAPVAGNVPLTAADIDAPTVEAMNAALQPKIENDDPRLSDARTPTAHAASHATGGTDPISPTDIGAIGLIGTAVAGAVPVMTAAGALVASTVDPAALQTRVTNVEKMNAALARSPELLIAGALTRDASSGLVTSAVVQWPDGSAGTYTVDTVNTIWGAVDAYHVTFGAPVTKTYTQPLLTRDVTSGAVTTLPAIAVS